MIVQYGTYRHDLGEVAPIISREIRRNEDGTRSSILNRWELRGVLHRDTSAELRQAVRRLEEAYSIDKQDIRLLFPDGTVAHELRSADSLLGTQIVRGVDYPEGEGAEWSTFRSYAITVEAETPVSIVTGTSAVDRDTSFSETIAVLGTGGPRYVWKVLLEGPPQRQQTAQRTVVRITQSGQATRRGSPPIVPGPIWPGLEVSEQRSASVTGPTSVQDTYKSTWQYVFESSEYLTSLPHVRI